MDDLKATLEYDMTSYLSEPRWMDGLQHFLGVGYETGLSIVIDLRCVVMPIEQRSAALSGCMECVTGVTIMDRCEVRDHIPTHKVFNLTYVGCVPLQP